ncbi:DUF6476 family protein [Actibacterium sp. MT2.3-13A]|uniref:DUF6476 family protein n=1 Tax=Actibacterium sp. MT2.3-13A TaxID=2828332 RepID=UPI001BAC432F|nr:DUF6476 family protein [Actibacterium sp. MT2.3-13A]
MDMDDAPQPVDEPANLKFLRRLVTVLTAVMIAGVLVIIALLVIRLSDRPAPWPDEIALPEGARAQAVTRGKGWVAVVTEDQRLLIFDAATGALEQEIAITAGH